MTSNEPKQVDEEPRITLSEKLKEELRKPLEGMSYARYRELSDLVASGANVEFAEGEEKEYQRFESSMNRLQSSLRDSAYGNLTRNLEHLKAPETAKFTIPRPNAAMEAQLEEIVGHLVEQRQQEEKNSTYLRLMSETLIETRAARESADNRAEAQAKLNKVFSLVALFLALAAVVVPFVIESIKGWQ